MDPADLSNFLSYGAAGVAIVMSLIWMKHVKEMRAENSSHVENVTKTIERVATEFAVTSKANMETVARAAASFEQTARDLHQQTADLAREIIGAAKGATPQ